MFLKLNEDFDVGAADPPWEFSNATLNPYLATFAFGDRLDQSLGLEHLPFLPFLQLTSSSEPFASSCLNGTACLELNLFRPDFRSTHCLGVDPTAFTVRGLPFYHLRVVIGRQWQSLGNRKKCTWTICRALAQVICVSTVIESDGSRWLGIGN